MAAQIEGGLQKLNRKLDEFSSCSEYGTDSFDLVNGTSTQKKSKSNTANGAELGISDHEDSDEDKEDEVAAGENGASGG